MEIVPKLFQNIHMVANSSSWSPNSPSHRLDAILSSQRTLTLIFDLYSSSVRWQFRGVSNVLHIPTLYLTNICIPVLNHALGYSIWSILPIIVMLVTVKFPFFIRILIRLSRELPRNWIWFDHIVDHELQQFLIPLFKIRKSRSLVDILRLLSVKFRLLPHD
jgi:hypothetical protein